MECYFFPEILLIDLCRGVIIGTILQAEAGPSLGIKTSSLFPHTQLVIVTDCIEVKTACDLFDVLVQWLREEPLGGRALWGVFPHPAFLCGVSLAHPVRGCLPDGLTS